MIKTLLYFLLTSFLFAQTLSYGEHTKKTNEYKKIFCVHFLSVSENFSDKKILQSIPKDIREKTHLKKYGKYVVAEYQKRTLFSEILKDLKFIKAHGYTDAYIRSRKILEKQQKKQQKEKQTQKKIKKVTKTLSKTTISSIISKANKAYENKNYMQAIVYYEMLLSSGSKNIKVKNNLCYLYGREGAYAQAEAIINEEKYPAKLIYAYAYGSATTGQKSFYKNMAPYISLDRSGKLMLLSGYYFEEKHEMKRALTFYKMAYEKNNSSSYNLYAYARAEDILNHKQNALKLYKKLLGSIKKSTPFYKSTSLRVYQLGK